MKDLKHELDDLHRRAVDMGYLTEAMVTQAVETIAHPHDQRIDQVRQDEGRLNRLQLEIDRESNQILSRYRPTAGDLRFLFSVGHINTALEKIGDNAVRICDAAQHIVPKPNVRPVPHLEKMAGAVRVMMGDALAALVQRDIRKSRATIARDNLLDRLIQQTVGELLDDDLIRDVIANDRSITWELAQLLIARSLERIGGQSASIAKELVHMFSPVHTRHMELRSKVPVPHSRARVGVCEPAV
jgi:phosphate transport system protein